ncbi:integrase [Corynebacterium sp. HMSC072G08]|uniref:tyrosine-type recombinase/integrase n=1 Tax=Corynebacterium sp. HMSC072G08 TaxID=1715039 RepID=UPI0008A4A25D|nr:site-specific integrase [Corynebacterium sp. HMSC072G08]OFN40253.1 integrase [Corynebacterium sp. HMSC072G08]
MTTTKKKRRSPRDFGKVAKKGKRFYADYLGPDGARHTPGHSFPTRIDADGWLSDERRLIDLDTWTPPAQRKKAQQTAAVTVGEWLNTFHDGLTRRVNPLKPSTMQNYRRVVKVRITAPYGRGANDPDVTFLKDVKLVELTKADVHRWWDGLRRNYSEQGANVSMQAYKRLKAACAEAVERELIPTNPVSVRGASHVPIPKEKYLPTDKEITDILDAIPARYRVLTSLILHHGLRIGEALALETRHVTVTLREGASMPSVTVTVEQNAQRITDDGHNYMMVQTPKTKAGFRTIPIMATDVPYFLDHLEKYVSDNDTVLRFDMHGKRGNFPARLLTTTSTGNMLLDTSYRSALQRAVAKAGANPAIHPHAGRRWLITRLAEQGAHLKEIGQLLGQDDYDTIMDAYMSVRAERTTSLMEKVANTLEGDNE